MTLLVTEEETRLFHDYGYLMDMDKRTRALTGKERRDAEAVFKKSVDYDRVLVSNASGMGGRAFTELAYFKINVVETDKTETHHKIPFNILNIPDGWGKDYPRRLLHEMTHVWQSQHAMDPEAYFWNSMRNQIKAAVKGLDYDDYSKAYDFVPGHGFSWYNAEQIARAVGTHRDARILAHIQSVPKNTRDNMNETSLKIVNGGDMNEPVERGLYEDNAFQWKHMY